MKKWPFLIVICLFLTACLEEGMSPTPITNEAVLPSYTTTLPTTTGPLTVTVSIVRTPGVTQNPTNIAEITPSISAQPKPAVTPYDWRELPVIPTVSPRVISIYQQGLVSGNDPRAFSKIGDGNVSSSWFFSMFDLGPEFYDLGPYDELSAVITYFAGSFGRVGFAARRGFNTSLLLSTSSTGSDECLSTETPVECELRLHRPCIAILSLGTNQVWEPEIFESELHQLLDLLVSRGVVPILSTKADNLERDARINHIIAQLAQEYEVPLWNFWRAVQSLPDHGLQEDNEHLTYAPTNFEDEHTMQAAWPVRNLTALQALDSVWRGLTTESDMP